MADLRVRCPWCIEETGSLGKRPYGRHVSVNLEKGTFLCWRCGRGKGEVLTRRVMHELGLGNTPFNKAQRRKFTADGNEIEEMEEPVEDLPDGYEPLYPWQDVKDSIALAPYLRYLFGPKRKLTPKHLRKFKVGAVLDPKSEKWRRGFLCFPLLDHEYTGFVLHKTEQAWFKECSAYVNSRGLQRLEGALLNGRILKSDLNPIYVVEGAFDVVAMNNHAVGTLGTGYTEGQFNRLLGLKQDLVIAFDGDAWRAGMALARRFQIRGKENTYWVKLPPGRKNDPGRLGWVNVGKLPTFR